MDEVLDRSALEQAALVRAREIASEELVRWTLDRIDARNEATHAFVELAYERAILEARALDRRHRRGREHPPFFGVPIAVKDLNLARGLFSRFGSRAFRSFYSVRDDATVSTLREGGFVIVGKTATSELGILPVTETDIHPPCRNAWRRDRTPGGSSGGAGAAVAAGMVPIAQGSDGGGSIRIPSALSGLFGIKSSRGRVRSPFPLPDSWSLAVEGPLGTTVDDVAALLDVMAGITTSTPHWAPRPPATFLELSRRPPPHLRIRVTTASPLVATDPEIARATRRIGDLLASMGHDVKEGAPLAAADLDRFIPIWAWLSTRAPVVDEAELQPATRFLRALGRSISPELARERTHELGQEVLRWFGDADVWVTPTVAIKTPRVGAFSGDGERVFRSSAPMGAFTAPFNVSGQPAVSVPAGLGSDGLPIGVQLAGKPYSEALLLALGRALERAQPWPRHAPPPA